MDEAFFTDITNYLTVEVFPIILESLRTKGFNLTADDLLDIINEPITSDTSNHCIYQFRRGGNKGLFCNKPVAPGNNYCSNCIKTHKNLGLEDLVINSEPTTKSGQLNVVIHDSERGLYRDPNTNFIIYQLKSGIPAVIGKLDNHTIISLTDNEIQMAQVIGLFVPEQRIKDSNDDSNNSERSDDEI